MSLENLETTFEPTLEPTMLRSLKTLALQHKKRLFATFGLVAAENLLLLIYPLVGSFAVNAVLNGQLISALAYALIVLIIWGVGGGSPCGGHPCLHPHLYGTCRAGDFEPAD
ncbi:ABC transporter six-transmembrane domain-containing protein [Glaesserella parasuis]|uniref:ABC transporter six-transmembrane domain-containing protein n=1 Tax=Glaesserella parasuis TaxID=738 RepID=A0AAJ6DA68_GLAPU|nr:ABC transporter six-transmembrane domain-containing protein [Glaesserella parasuis]MDG6232168.1 ABC transporter six-transmembrane domain-containing protein [Glaesserella parasuis]MDG6309680.1 ABC transporter six-transmembrane domain-containing protein [Glaesserella parasuis]MDG6361643.1 ABC transporter six-transmembrane domain-containing protein [Glaesserella parasuis]MDG6761368.1 ABC transporter six-transmembrane domain-containing protein [Glaesserella parasuis]MDO9731851.1 ABC transporter